jgi:hypothetical protein
MARRDQALSPSRQHFPVFKPSFCSPHRQAVDGRLFGVIEGFGRWLGVTNLILIGHRLAG